MDEAMNQNVQNPGAGEKRLSLILSSSVYEDLSAVAKKRQTTVTEMVRLGLGLAKIAINEAEKGNKLIVANPDGQVLKELVLPELQPPRPAAISAPPPAPIPA
jgi:hypothetical protein